jgi:ADP-ribosylglycohydrolase
VEPSIHLTLHPVPRAAYSRSGLLGFNDAYLTRMKDLNRHLTAAWQGRISGCQLGKAVEVFSMRQGQAALSDHLRDAGALPLRDYVPPPAGEVPEGMIAGCCKGQFDASAADDDINYSVLALIALENHGAELGTEDIGRLWLNHLPVGMTFTAERAAYRTLLNRAAEWFPQGAKPGFDVTDCADNECNDWIGAQIRADVYGWVTPGRPQLGAELARRDAALSHRGDGIYGAMFVAATGSACWDAGSLSDAVDAGARQIPTDSGAAAAIELARQNLGAGGDAAIRAYYAELSPVHVLNNLALVVWALLSFEDDYAAAIGEVVAAGLDTDCNAATVGGLWGLFHGEIPGQWTDPWRGEVGVSLAGHDRMALDALVQRTVSVTEQLAG